MVHTADAQEPAELWAWCVQGDHGGSCGTGTPPAELPVLGTVLVMPVSLPDGWAVQATSRPVGCAWGSASLLTEVRKDLGTLEIALATASGVVDVDINASGPSRSTLSATARWDTGRTASNGCQSGFVGSRCPSGGGTGHGAHQATAVEVRDRHYGWQ